jgi:UDP-3-O-[3-hydroxymyristoyl] glucosamine N-acyltransferase
MKFETPLTLETVAQLMNAEFEGSPSMLVTGINEIHMVEPGDITFVDHPKYYSKALNSAATFVIINKRVPCPEGKALLFSDDPFSAYIKLVKKFRPFEACSSAISPTAQIGEGTVIQPGAFIGNHVKIGKNCIIHANSSIYDHTVIGDNVIIHSNTAIGGDAFYFKRRPDFYDKMESCGRVVIHNNVEIGCSCSIDKGVSGDTVIGEGSKLDNQIHIGHDTVIGKNCLLAGQVGIAGVTTLEDEVILWGCVSVQKDLVIGKGAVLLGRTGVTKSLEGGITYYGTPAMEARKQWKEQAILKKVIEEFETKRESELGK